MKKVIVLGAGMVGTAMAIDLSGKFETTIADFNQTNLNNAKSKCMALQTLNLNVNETDILKNVLANFNYVVCAVPGFLGYKTLKTIIECKKNVVDISFFPEDALTLHELAVQNNVTAIVDCGVAPGMDNLILGYYNEKLILTDFECYVGGLPKEKKWPFNYKAPFSPVDVIEEYTRPARYVENGCIITREPLTDVELMHFDGVGTLEAFNSDGLRSIIYTMPNIKNRKEKTLRYPGHVEYIRVLKDTGFFSSEKIKIDNKEISPLEFTSKLLFNEWKLKDGEEEITVMRVVLKGKNKEGRVETVICNLYDAYCHKTKTSSMSRTTGYTATAALNLIDGEIFNKKGVYPPEMVGKSAEAFKFVIAYLAERNVKYTFNASTV